MKYFEEKSLLETIPSTHHAAYNDHTSWLMASMAQAAYIKFEDPQKDLDKIAEKLLRVTELKKIRRILKDQIIDNISFYRGKRQGEKKLRETLYKAKFELIKPFDEGGTQGFIAKSINDKIAVLAFRGTQATNLKDIITDLNFFLKDQDGARAHKGFLNAFECVKHEIKEILQELTDYNIYITGHSLGGALALVATRALQLEKFENIAACYTFGSPRVGNEDFGSTITTPVYRIVNTLDIVPRLPPGIIVEVSVDILRLLKGFVFSSPLEWLAKKIDDGGGGYRLYGDMRYLTDCEKEDYSDIQLLRNITLFARVRRFLKNRRMKFWNRLISDHNIDLYCKKLGKYALNMSAKKLLKTKGET